MWPLHESGPDQADTSTQTEPDSPTESEQLNFGSMDPEAMCDEIERLHERIKIIERHAQSFQTAQVLAEEQSRRRAELLEDAVQESEAVRRDNRILITQIASLQSGTEIFTDEEAKREMCLLYHDLEQWGLSNFRGKPTPEQMDNSLTEPETDPLTLNIILSKITGTIFRTFWNRPTVGAESILGEYLREIDLTVKKHFSNHIALHWRCATSTAMLLLGRPSLQYHCNLIAEQAEEDFGHYAITDKSRRVQQLLEIVERCVYLKHRLECQADAYMFWCSISKMPFRNERMRSLEEKELSDGYVEVSLWPGLFKMLQDGEWSVVEKEIVKTLPTMDEEEFI